MICQRCGIEAPTKRVAFYQNIGALVMRFSQSMDGYLCKSCIHSTFWQYTLTTSVLGWWGVISFIVTPFFLVNNVARYATCLGMAPVPFGAMPPELNEAAIQRLQPVTEDLISRLNQGDEAERVFEDIALKAGVTKGQVALYLRALLAASKQSPQ